MKKILLPLLLALCLTACMEDTAGPRPQAATPAAETAAASAEASATPAPDLPPALMDGEEYPRVDGSTATIPLSAALLSRACAIPLEEAELYVNHSTTNYAFNNLLGGACDLLLVYEPPAAAYEFAAAIGKDLDADLLIAPVGKDALVFLVNESNPVAALTREQLLGIYTGEIVTWTDVGGADAPIDAFQRDPDSGSQTLMRKLVLGDIPPMIPPAEMIPGSMGELVEKILDFDNSDRAIGYSVYYYIRNMVGMPGLRMLAVDGVEPDDRTIAEGSYPYTNDFYVAIRADEPQGSPARVLYDFLLSADGQALVEAAGYVPAGAGEP